MNSVSNTTWKPSNEWKSKRKMNVNMNVMPNEALDRLAIAAAQKTKEKEYWLNRLSGKLEKTVFPSDRQKTGRLAERRAFATGREKFRFTGAPFQRLMALSNGSDNRLLMLLVGTLVTLLWKYTRNNDVTVGTTILKQKQGIDETKLINTVLPLRIQTDDNMAFRELLAEVKETVTGANENRNYPHDILVKHLDLTHPGDKSPLFDIGIVVENIQDKRYFRHIRPDMIVSFRRTENCGEGEVEYNSLLYETETIKRLLTHFATLLEQAVFNVGSKLSELGLLSHEEKKRILQEFNNTKKEIRREKSYHQLFEEQAARVPEDTAVISSSGRMSYRELNEEANPIASLLIELGVKANDIVGIYMKRSLKMPASIIGIFKAGGAYLALDVDYPEERIVNILEDSEVKILITEKENAAFIDGIKDRLSFLQTTLCLDHNEKTGDTLNRDPGINPGVAVSTDSLAYIIYTSGTTGKPKGVMIHQLGMLNHIYANVDFLSVTSSDVIAQTASPCFDISVWQFLTAPILGGKTFIIDREQIVDPLRLLDVLQEGKITILEAVPSLMGAFLAVLEQWGRKELNHLKWMIPTGEALSVSLAREWYNYFPAITLVNAYGPAETSDDVTLWVIEADALEGRSTIPIGKPLQNLHIYIMDNHLSLCPVRMAGEICIAGLGVGKGYLKDPEKTAKSFVPNPYIEEIGDKDYSTLYRTGDMGCFTGDGNIEFLGRKDHQVKVRGFRIELEEIENQLLDAEQVKEAVVVAKDGQNDGDKYLCAYVVPDTLALLSAATLREHLSRNLPYYMVPSYFVVLDKIPLTPNGKMDRKALPDPEIHAGNDHIAPRDKLEEALAKLWAEVLNVEKSVIGIDSNFFESGGHSLKATILVTRAHKEFNVRFPLPELFRTPHIRGMAEYIRGAAKEEIVSLEALEKKEYYPVSSQQKRMYILQQKYLSLTAYNMPNAYISGMEFDKEKLEATCRKLIQRHESLRTSVHMVDGKPVQRVHHDVPFTIEYYNGDLTGESKGNFLRPFDLSRAPLFRVGITKPGDGQNILMVDIHHIISDGISGSLLVNDFMALYQGKQLPALKFQYKDFSHWQARLVEAGEMKKQEEYWLETFAGEIPELVIPRDYTDFSERRFEGSKIFVELDEKKTVQLNELAKREGTTLFMLLLACYSVLLAKLGGQEDIVVGTGVAGRRHADFEKIIGMFVNTLALRNYPAEEKTFKEFLHEVREQTLQAFENQDYLFEDLVEKVVTKSDPGRNPIFDTSFVVQNMGNGPGDPGNAEPPESMLKQQEIDKKMSIFDIAVFCGEIEGKLGISVSYSTGVFKKETIEKYFAYYKDILSFVIENKELSFTLKDIRLTSGLEPIELTIIPEEAGSFGF